MSFSLLYTEKESEPVTVPLTHYLTAHPVLTFLMISLFSVLIAYGLTFLANSRALIDIFSFLLISFSPPTTYLPNFVTTKFSDQLIEFLFGKAGASSHLTFQEKIDRLCFERSFKLIGLTILTNGALLQVLLRTTALYP